MTTETIFTCLDLIIFRTCSCHIYMFGSYHLLYLFMSVQADLRHVEFATELTGIGIQPTVMLCHVVLQLALVWQKTQVSSQSKHTNHMNVLLKIIIMKSYT